MDIIVLDSLISDGVSLPSGLDYDSLSSAANSSTKLARSC